MLATRCGASKPVRVRPRRCRNCSQLHAAARIIDSPQFIDLFGLGDEEENDAADRCGYSGYQQCIDTFAF